MLFEMCPATTSGDHVFTLERTENGKMGLGMCRNGYKMKETILSFQCEDGAWREVTEGWFGLKFNPIRPDSYCVQRLSVINQKSNYFLKDKYNH